MAGRIWLDPPGFVYVSLGAGGLQQQLPPPGSAGLPRARRAGSLGTAIVRLHKHPSVCLAPPPPLPPSPDPTGVAGRGAGRGPGCPGLGLAPESRPGAFCAPLLLRPCARPAARRLLLIHQASVY